MSEDIRILLWDIDGTLMRSVRAESFKEYTIPVLESIFGTAGRLAEMTVSGMTDWQIVLEALRDEGFTHDEIRARVGEVRALYVAELERVTSAEGGAPVFEVLPGARAALAAADAHPRYRSALLTGNVEPAARLKVRLAGLAEFFTLPGAFGDDSHDRRDLPALAAERIRRRTGLDLRPSQLIVIGDTPNDISCARHFGARCLALTTGRFTAADLAPHNPDAILADLSDTELFMRALAGL
jgi:phosphoglycolate phosphatase